MAAGRYKLPWEVQVTDGSSCGFAPPTREYAGVAE
jgi:formamidase